MLDNIVDVLSSKNYEENDRAPIFLTEDGSVYTLVANYYNNAETNVRKIIDNVKTIKTNRLNVAFIDNNSSAYVYGYNIEESGVLGMSNDNTNKYQTVPQKIGDNIKDIFISSSAALRTMFILTINNNNELFIMGENDNYDSYFMGSANNQITESIKITDSVECVYPTISEIYIKKLDGSLYVMNIGEDNTITKIMDDCEEVYVPNSGYGGILALNDNNELYAYGQNNSKKFGVGENIEEYSTATKVLDNVEKVFMSEDYSGSSIFVIKTDGELYAAGSNIDNALGITGEKQIANWTKVEIPLVLKINE